MNDSSVPVIFIICLMNVVLYFITVLTIYNVSIAGMEPLIKHLVIQNISDFRKEVNK